MARSRDRVSSPECDYGCSKQPDQDTPSYSRQPRLISGTLVGATNERGNTNSI
jgi:hypothetical protein